MKRCAAFLILFVLLFSFSSVAQEPDIADAAPGTRTVRVGFPVQEGLTEIDENGQYSGYTYEYLERLAQFTGWEYEYVTPEGDLDTQLLTLMDMLANGEVDIVGGFSRNDALEQLYEYPKAGYGSAHTILAALETNVALNEVNFAQYATEGIRVGAYSTAVNRVEQMKAYFKANDYNYKLSYYDTREELMKALNEGTIDVCLGSDLGREQRTKTVVSFAGVPYYLAATKGNTELTDKLDQGMTQLEQSDPYIQKNLYNKYFMISGKHFALTNAEKTYVETAPEICVLIDSEIPPFQSRDKHSGISISLMESVAAQTGLKFKYVVGDPQKTLKQNIADENISIVLGVPYEYSYAKKHELILSQPFIETEVAAFSKRSIDMKNLKDKVLALPKDAALLDEFSSSDIRYYDTLHDCIWAVNRGEADYGYGNTYSVNYYRAREIYTDITTLHIPGRIERFCFGFSRPADMELLTLINRAVDTVSANEIYEYLLLSAADNQISLTVYDYVRIYPGQVILLSLAAILLLSVITILILRRSQKRRLREVKNEARSQFLSQVSHDMRTPMNAIIGLSSLGEESKTLDEAVSYHKNVHQSGSYLLRLINDTLDMSKIDSDKISLNPYPYHYQEFAGSLENILKPQAEEKGIEFRVHTSLGRHAYAMLDALRLQQIFLNLLNNAIKFTPPGGHVNLFIKVISENDDKMHIRFSIEDDGIGMSEEFQKKMYEPFEQEANDVARNEVGTGLGLPIAKRLVDLMGGTIQCESSKGKGTNFIVDLTVPVALPPEETADQIPDAEDILDGKCILVAEDHPLNTQIVFELLKQKGIRPIHAANGEEAFEQFEKSEEGYFDAILMDIRMPVMDGLEAAAQIRNLDRDDAGSIPIIAMTANTEQEDKEKTKWAGMDAHLCKPVEPQVMYQTLEDLLLLRSVSVH